MPGTNTKANHSAKGMAQRKDQPLTSATAARDAAAKVSEEQRGPFTHNSRLGRELKITQRVTNVSLGLLVRICDTAKYLPSGAVRKAGLNCRYLCNGTLRRIERDNGRLNFENTPLSNLTRYLGLLGE